MGSNGSKGFKQEELKGPKRPKAKANPPSSSNKKHKEQYDENLRWLIGDIAANTSAATLDQIIAALQISNKDKTKIVNKFPGQVEKQAKAMMHLWVKLEPRANVQRFLTQLKSVGFSYNWQLCEEDNPRAVEQGADRQPEPAVTQQNEAEGEDKEKEAPPQTIIKYVENNHIYLPENKSTEEDNWTGAELMSTLERAPDPFTKPRAFHKWLRAVCIVYQLRPAQVHMLLKLVYGTKWEKAERHLRPPGGGRLGDWPDADAMITWLDNSCASSVDKTAWDNADLGAIGSCYQGPKELVTDFLERFQQVWDSTFDLPMEYGGLHMFPTLVNNLQPHVAELFKLRSVSWSTCTFSEARTLLTSMQRAGMLDSKTKALQAAEYYRTGLPALPSPASSNETFTRGPRRDKRRDQCYSCGRFGHWARECRAVQYY